MLRVPGFAHCLVVCCFLLASSVIHVTTATNDHARNTFAVIVSTSRYWHNYRHASNAMLLYRIMRDAGVPDDNIVLLMAEQYACDARNVYRGHSFADSSLRFSL